MDKEPSTAPENPEEDVVAKNAFQEIDEGGKPVDTEPEQPEEPVEDPQPEEPKPEETPTEPPVEPTEPPKAEEPQQRPERYIPMPKYHEEKSKWEQREAELNKELETLRSQAQNANTPAQNQAAEDKIKAWAEKNGMDYEAAKELSEVILSGVPQIPKETLEAIEQSRAQAREQESQTRFNNEFDKDVTPLIRSEYPEATEQQLAAAKKVMDELAHTKELSQTPLSYIFHGNKGDFAEIFTDKPGFERSKPTNIAEIKGSHFKGKTDFSAILSLPPEEQERVHNEMDPETANALYDWMEKNDSGMEINRGGRIIRLR